jgi:hypothetical protein
MSKLHAVVKLGLQVTRKDWATGACVNICQTHGICHTLHLQAKHPAYLFCTGAINIVAAICVQSTVDHEPVVVACRTALCWMLMMCAMC